MATKIIKAWINGAVQEIEVEDVISPAQNPSVEDRLIELEDKPIITDGNLLVGNGTEELEEMTPEEVLSHINGASVMTMTTAEYEALGDDEANANTLYVLTDDDSADSIMNNKADTIQTASGSIITANNSAYTPLKGLSVFGSTTQNGTPTPAAPVALESAGSSGSLVVSVAGKNLINPQAYIDGGAYRTTLDGDVFTSKFRDGALYININRNNNETYLPKGTYTATLFPLTEGVTCAFFIYSAATKAQLGVKYNIQAGNASWTFTINEAFCFAVGGMEPYGEYSYKLQLEVGTASTAYEPYKAPQTLSIPTPNGLAGIPVASGGNYTDQNGQQWVCDEIDCTRGVYVQRIGNRTFTGDETDGWLLNNGDNETVVKHFYTPALVGYVNLGYPNVLCTMLTYNSNAGSSNSTQINVCRLNPNYGYLLVDVDVTEFSTLEAFKAFLAEKPMTVSYVLASPIETAIDEETLAAYATLHTNNPNTVISNDANANMQIQYYTPLTAVQMVHSPADEGKVLTIDKHGCVTQKNAVGQFTVDGGEIFNDYEYNDANGLYSHAEGKFRITTGEGSHAEGTGKVLSSYGLDYDYNVTPAYATMYLQGEAGSTVYVTGSPSDKLEVGQYLYYEQTGKIAEVVSLREVTLDDGYPFSTGKVITVTNTLDSENSLVDEMEGGYPVSIVVKTTGDYSHSEGVGSRANSFASHAEGVNTLVTSYDIYLESALDNDTYTGYGAHVEGIDTLAIGNGAHAEGTSVLGTVQISGEANATTYTVISGIYSYQVGLFLRYSGNLCRIVSATTVSGSSLQEAETVTLDKTLSASAVTENFAIELIGGAVGTQSHASGKGCYASGEYSHAQGYHTIASGNYSTASGYCAIASGPQSHAEGGVENCLPTTASGHYSHAEGVGTLASGPSSHAQGFITTASGAQSHAEGYKSQALNSRSHAEGQGTISQGVGSHSEGQYTAAVGVGAHAEGLTTIDTPWYLATTPGLFDVIPMSETAMRAQYQSGGLSALPEVGDLLWSSDNDIARVIAVNIDNEDLGNTYFVTNKPLHIVNGYAKRFIYGALGNGSHSEGLNTVAASAYQHAQGKYNVEDSANKYAHIVGGGAKDSHSNIHTLEWTGKATYAGAVASSTGADYAEYFEWEDGNPNNEDRVGLIVVLNGEKIRLATNKDEDILGIISGTAAVVGDTAEWEWRNKYLTDDFGRVIWDMVEEFVDEKEEYEVMVEETVEHVDDEGNVITETVQVPKTEYRTVTKSVGFFPHRRLNPDYNADKEYTSRAERQEWDTVGMLGKLYVRDDGTCKVNGYVCVGENGIATASAEKTNMRMLSRVDDSIVRVLLK